MRVLFDHQIFSLQARGGISRYVVELATRLAGHPGVAPCICAGWHRSLTLRESTTVAVHGRYVRPWPLSGPFWRSLNLGVTRRHVRRWRPDLVHET